MRLFFDPNIESTLVLNETEAKHATRVLRLGVGDQIQVIDGKGNSFICQFEEINKKLNRVKIIQKDTFEKSLSNIHIAISPTKNQDRIEWFVEKSVEIGVQQISFIMSKRTERSKVNFDRIQRIAVSAMKQSKKFWMPKITELIPYSDFLVKVDQQIKLIAHLNEGDRKFISDYQSSTESYCLLIGPEGDFTDDEVNEALTSGFEPVSLGESRLRTETAGVVGCTQLNMISLL